METYFCLMVTAAWATVPISVGLVLDGLKLAHHLRRGVAYRYLGIRFLLTLGLTAVGSVRLSLWILDRHGESPLLAGLLMATAVPAVFSAGLLAAVVLGMAGYTILGLNLGSVLLILAGGEQSYFLGWSELVRIITGGDNFWLAFACFLLSTLAGLAGLLYLFKREFLTEYTGLAGLQRAAWRLLNATYGRLLRFVLPIRRGGEDDPPQPPALKA